MARQPKTSKRSYARMSAERNKIKCPICGNETSKATPVKVKGIMTWVCTICSNRLKKKDGM